MVRCFSWPIGACQREGEVEGEEKIFWEIFVVEENGRKEKDILGKHVVVEEGRNKGKGKRKRNYDEKIFSWSPKMKISETQIPELKSVSYTHLTLPTKRIV